MRLFPFDHAPVKLFRMPDHGGNSVKGGGHPGDQTVSADEEISDAMGELVSARKGIPGTNDPGVPGSRTQTGEDKPLEDESARAYPHSGPQTGEGSGSGGSDKGGELDHRK
jgi:hypothetical protein